MLISIGGINIASSFITPLSGAALAEDSLLPSIVAKRNQYGSPYIAIIITSAASSFFVLYGTFTELIAISIICRFIQYISTCLAVFALHQKGILFAFDKKWKIVFPLIGLMGIGWLLLLTPFTQLLWGIGAIAAGIPLYFLQKFRNKLKPCLPE